MDLMQGTGRDIAKGEAVEHELDAFISKRHERRVQDEGDGNLEEMWKARERLDAARRRRQLASEWCGWHRDRAAAYRRFAAEHEAAVERLTGGDAA